MKRIVFVILFLIYTFLTIASPVDKSKLLSLLRKTDFYIASGNYEKAEESRDQALVLFEQLGAENDLSTISLLHTISHAYSEKGMYSDAVITESLLVEVFPLALPENTSDYALFLNDLAYYLMEDSSLDLASENITKALTIIENENDVDLAIIYVRAAEIYSKILPNRLDLSIEYQKKAVEAYANAYGKTSSSYLDELWYLADYYEHAGEFEDACNAYLEIMRTRAEADDETDMDSFLPVLDRIIYCSRMISNTEREEQCKQIAFSIKLQGKDYHEAKYSFPEFPSLQDSLDYITISDCLGGYKGKYDQYKEEGDKDGCEQVNKDIKQYLAELPDIYGKAYCLSIETLRNSLLLDSEKTIEYGLEALRVYDKIGVITENYVITLCCVASAYNELDNPAKAYDYILKAFELRDDYLSSDSIYYDGIPSDLSLYCSELGNYGDAIKYGTIALRAKEYLIYSDAPYAYFNSLNNLATCYGALGYHEYELELLQFLKKRAEDIAPSVLEFPESPFLFNLASCFSANGDYSKAIEVGLRVKEMRDKWGNKSFLSSIDLLLAKTYRRDGNAVEALNYANQANSILKEFAGEDNLSLSDSYDLLAMIYKDLGKNTEAEKMERCAIQLTYNNIVHNFADLSSDDRTSYWGKHSNLFNIWYPNYFYRSKNQDASELYNKSALFAKGILLNTDTEMATLINESGDSESLDKYRQLLQNKTVLSSYELSGDPGIKASIDSLKKENQRIERELISGCKAFGDYTMSMKTTWLDVQSALDPQDVAIEFICFPLIDEEDNILENSLYLALVVRKTDTCPHLVFLFDDKELELIGEDGFYNKKLYNHTWGALNKYLSGAKNIYFSPAGKLYNINIEVLPEIVGKNKGVNFYRVSSTRVLALANSLPTRIKEKAVIYGGLKYDTSVSDLIADSQLYKDGETQFRGNVKALDLRYGTRYLPETLTEVNAIKSSLEKSEIPLQIYTASLGTETSFKSLNDQPNRIIHIATHGFYYSESDSVKMKEAHLDYYGDQIDKSSRSYKEDYSLTRSGLLMAGCDNILHGEKLPGYIDDGILFSKEIATLNLKNVELVTLSTCDSGLGDITGEGVFGLQRAFKKAGAQTILMSLWKVDDNATCILMTQFYENYISKKKTKTESLKEAQRYVRTIEGGRYSDPRYWAAFIILDAM